MSLLSLNKINVAYGHVQVLYDLSVDVEQGDIVCLLGANGAGKSTTIKAIMGMVPLMRGSVNFAGEVITGLPSNKIVQKKIAIVPEGRHIFPLLSVAENLQMGAYTRNDKAGIAEDLAYVFEVFPLLKEREKQMGGTLSGGEQQMLAIGRALMSRPTLLLMDEPSMGLAPIIWEEIFRTVTNINKQRGTTVFLVEQNAAIALAVSKYGYVLETGRITYQGTTDELRQNDVVAEAYLGKKGASRPG